jgi:hypothetical protein
MVTTQQIGAGGVMPDFELLSITDGQPARFSEFGGKKIALFMWASW